MKTHDNDAKNLSLDDLDNVLGGYTVSYERDSVILKCSYCNASVSYNNT